MPWYNFVLWSCFLQERLPMTLPKIVELVTKKEIPALQRYLIFEVCTRSALNEIK